MMSHHLSWKGEGAVENLGAGAFLLILGLFWGIWEQRANCPLLAGCTGR